VDWLSSIFDLWEIVDLGTRPCGKLKALPPCAFDGFVSNIKMFPMAMLPGWPFAPSKTPGAEIV